MIMNCSLCLNSHPQIVLQRTLSSYFSQSEVYRAVIFGLFAQEPSMSILKKLLLLLTNAIFKLAI